jgi:hypothetical protein
LYTKRPISGLFIGLSALLLATSDTLGINKPEFADSMCNLAELCGVEVPIPTFCAKAAMFKIENRNKMIKAFN